MQVVVLGAGEAEIIRVRCPGDPKVAQGEMVRVEGVTARELGAQSGMVFRALAFGELAGLDR